MFMNPKAIRTTELANKNVPGTTGNKGLPMNNDEIATAASGTPFLLVLWKIEGACPSLARAQMVLEAK